MMRSNSLETCLKKKESNERNNKIMEFIRLVI